MTDAGASRTTRALAVQALRDVSDSSAKRRSVRSAAAKQWSPPEGLTPDEILAVIDAASTERDRLLLRVLWATGARISEALDLRLLDVRRDSLVLPNLKNPSRLTKQVFLPAGQMDLPGALLLWAKEQGLTDGEPLFFSRKRAADGGRRPISRQQAWEVVRAASEQANVRVLALRESRYGVAGEPAPVHPHLFRHARVRQIVRTTKSLPIAQKQAGWSRLQMAYLSVSDDEVRQAMQAVEH
jgi:integrase/recombinase XerD